MRGDHTVNRQIAAGAAELSRQSYGGPAVAAAGLRLEIPTGFLLALNHCHASRDTVRKGTAVHSLRCTSAP